MLKIQLKNNSLIILILFLFILTFPKDIFSQQLFINEIMSSNSNTICDNDGDYSDWLELYNDDTVTVNLEGFGLSDKKDELMKWIFPNIFINPKDYLLIFASGKDQKYIISHWETIIDWGDEWKYQSGNADIPSNWNTGEFDDSEWFNGNSGFGYGDNDDNTIINKTISLFIRKSLHIDDLDNIARVLFHVDYDDGFVAYINGKEIARANIGVIGIPPAYNQVASSAREAEIIWGGKPEMYNIDSIRTLFKEGENVLGVQVHNVSANSSDLSLIPFLTLGLHNSPDDSNGFPEILELQQQFLHTNFKINSSGEYLSLCDSNGNLVDHVDEKDLPSDISWGRQPDGSDNWFLFEKPTPGLSNTTPGLRNIAEKPSFFHSGGFYTAEFNLKLTTDSQTSTIYYTTNGAEPTLASEKYTNPVLIDKTTVIKAKTINADLLSSETVTNTYFINENTSLAVVSLSTTPENLWDDEIGIYVEGTNGITGYCSDSPKNWNQDWERPATIEFFEPDKTPGFKINCGIKIGGGCTRLYAQKTLAVYTRSEYGDNEIEYQIFPDKPLKKYNNINLRNSGQDWYRALIRDGVMQEIVKDRMDIDWQCYRPIVMFINGEYWGIHGLREKHNEHYIAANYGIDPDAIDILKSHAYVNQGSASHYLEMINFIENNDLVVQENYEYVKKQMDIDEYINYQITEIYYANIDWPGGNIKFWRPQTPDGKWRWILFDLDLGFGAHSMGQYASNSLANATSLTQTYYANPTWSTFLFRSLLKNEDFKNEFIQRYCMHIGTTFERDRVLGIIDSLESLITTEVPRHVAKWPASTNLTYSWRDHIGIMKEFAILRPNSARNHLQSKFNLSGSSSITIINNSQKGIVKINGVELINQVTTIRLINNIPTRFEASPKPGCQFIGWKGMSTSSKDSINITFTENDTIIANFLSPSAITKSELVQKYRLYNNYPNPFNPVTTISYEISEESDVSLLIYDYTGRLLEILVNQKYSAGKYSIKWNAEKYSSGVYFYKIKNGEFQKVRKCLLLK